ncbi:putative tricarboxylic transport membrane protein [Planifilum fimeticola]|jgi:putative tricarboxylic transport membrane protein|uniref:Putative tricarboxylic transport membrane protein n=1 Tax=Planifilum fimeticola TaxID=201975 RepID=A0A2T0LDR8_9BACL|nr:tripartite tricarboxylate transporter TctB family protein [Planifilum fimeticola]PRX40227.1 putative tricarboxylic transport membrane protein [Planifilum fimeticola]
MHRIFDRTASLLFIAVGAAFILGARNLSSTAYGSRVGPDLFPMGLGALLILLSLRLFFETFRHPGKEESGDKGSLDWRRFGGMLAAALLYALLLETLGYVLSTFLFLFAGFQLIERGKWVRSAMVAAVFSGGVYFLYAGVMKGTLPGWPVWFAG